MPIGGHMQTVVGQRVFAPGKDGFLVPATVMSVKAQPDGSSKFDVQFEDSSSTEVVFKDIVGEGFSCLANRLKVGQNVYCLVEGVRKPGQQAQHSDFHTHPPYCPYDTHASGGKFAGGAPYQHSEETGCA
eukprot:Colp12_sorted_trinity150504_noHs@28963